MESGHFPFCPGTDIPLCTNLSRCFGGNQHRHPRVIDRCPILWIDTSSTPCHVNLLFKLTLFISVFFCRRADFSSSFSPVGRALWGKFEDEIRKSRSAQGLHHLHFFFSFFFIEDDADRPNERGNAADGHGVSDGLVSGRSRRCMSSRSSRGWQVCSTCPGSTSITPSRFRQAAAPT